MRKYGQGWSCSRVQEGDEEQFRKERPLVARVPGTKLPGRLHDFRKRVRPTDCEVITTEGTKDTRGGTTDSGINNKLFTLIEIVVGIAIIGVVIAYFIATFADYINYVRQRERIQKEQHERFINIDTVAYNLPTAVLPSSHWNGARLCPYPHSVPSSAGRQTCTRVMFQTPLRCGNINK